MGLGQLDRDDNNNDNNDDNRKDETMTTKAPKMVMNEWYGEIPATLNRALKKYNVPPASFAEMEDVYEMNDREIDHAQIERFIKANSSTGMYSPRWPLSFEEVLSA